MESVNNVLLMDLTELLLFLIITNVVVKLNTKPFHADLDIT
jgi:hypothetical protein